MSTTSDFFSPDERLVLDHWFGLENPLALTTVPVLDQALRRLGFVEEYDFGRSAAAVAAIVLNAKQKDLPQWVGWLRYPDGFVEEVTGRGYRPRRRQRLALLPRHLFTINWADSGPGMSWPCAYYLTWVPVYDRYVVTSSYDTDECLGYPDFAVGSFGPTEDAVTAAGEVIVADWTRQTEILCEVTRWEAFWDAGLIGEEQAKALADRVPWYGEWEEEDEGGEYEEV